MVNTPPLIVIFLLLAALSVVYALARRRGKLQKLTPGRWCAFALIFFAAFAIFRQANLSFKDNNFPYEQGGTRWESDGGVLSIDVSDESAGNFYYSSVYVDMADGLHTAQLGVQGRSDYMSLSIEDEDGVQTAALNFRWRMPNRRTLILNPVDSERAEDLLGSGGRIAVRRVEE